MEWEKVDLKRKSPVGCFITLTAGDHGMMTFSNDLNASAGRYDLLKRANQFAFKRSDSGQLRTTPLNGIIRVNSRGAVRLIREAFELSSE